MEAYENLQEAIPLKEGLNRICNEKLAILDLGDRMWSIKSKCPLYQIKEPLLFTYSSLPLQRHSPFTKLFNYM